MSGIWSDPKWKGKFDVSWVYVKNVPNHQLKHIRLENNEFKPVTSSRDTQEVPPIQVRSGLHKISDRSILIFLNAVVHLF